MSRMRFRVVAAFGAVAAVSGFMNLTALAADHEVRVRKTPGGAQLFVDGKAVPPRMLWVRPYHKPGDGGEFWEQRAYRHSVSQVARAAKAGVNLVTFLSPMLWEVEGGDYWEPLDNFCGDAIKANPNVLLVPRVYVNPPKWWLEKVHPDARMVYGDGKKGSKGSVSCREYRAAACDHLRRTIEHLQAKFPDNFAGIHFGGQNTGEWFYDDPWRSPSGYDPCTAKAWKAYVAERKLPAEWGERVPTAEERGDLARKRILLDEPGDRRVVEFNRFFQREMADMVGTLARTCRGATKGRKLVLSFYGYLYELCNLDKWGMATSGHVAVEHLLKTYGDALDMLCAPFGYGKDREWLGSEPVMTVAETFVRNGILWVNEDDTRTFLDTRKGAHLQEGGLKDASQTYDTLLRNTAQELVRGQGCWWMDLKGTGWFDCDEIWKPMTDLAALDRRFAVRPTPYAPEVASIVDEDSCLHLAFVAGKYSAWTFGMMRGNLARTGVPYGQYLLSDVCARPIAAKLQLFHAAMALSDERIDALAEDRRKRPDLTRVWFWAPGYVDPKSGAGDLKRMEKLTGFRFRKVAVPNNALAATAAGRKAGFAPKTENQRDVSPLFAVEGAKPEETWATYSDGSAAVVVRRNPAGRGYDVFYGGGEQAVETLVALERLAGCTFVHDAPGKLVAWAADDVMSVQALAAGEYGLSFPTDGEVFDGITGKTVGRGPRISVKFRLGETRMFAWADRQAAKPVEWNVVSAQYRKESASVQVRQEADGAHVALDRRRMEERKATWCGLAPKRAMELTPGGEVKIVCRIPKSGIVSAPGSLRVVDADGEVFRYLPLSTRLVDDRAYVTYAIREGGWAGAFFAGKPRKGYTEGRNRNDRFDPPLRLQNLAFGLKEEVEDGELVIESVEGAASSAERTMPVRETVIAFDREADRFVSWNARVESGDGKLHVASDGPASTLYNWRFPGMKPFPGTEDIILRTSRSWKGSAILNLVDPVSGEKMRLKAPWTEETHFRTNLPPGRTWQLNGFEFWTARDTKGRIQPMDFDIKSLEGVYRTTGAGACRLEAETGNGLRVCRGERERPYLTLTNVSSVPQRWKGVLRCRDFDMKGPDLPVDVAVGAGETVRMDVPDPLKKGIWRVFGEISSDDGSKATPETRFAVLDEHFRSPRLKRGERFRPGINWHGSRFSPGDRRLCEDALEACGCKLVRTGGFEFSTVERREGEWHWDRSDHLMAETTERGISIDAIIYNPPRWSQDTNRIDRSSFFKKYMVPSREGTFGVFAERIAARYGTDIDYYELGNEWDLIPEEIMTRDEAVRIHREGYEGVKRGCPAATVMPNGWTHPFVRPDHYGAGVKVGGDYHAYVMSRVKELSDVYPIHMHGPFRAYRKGVQQLFKLRKRIGCERLPWFASETACSSVNGMEDNVARFVFQKMMYSWANGSVDYIWYNLKATGWVESDSEQGYGMLTADFHPRASYAAFSAFTALYAGLAFDKTLIDRSSRLAYRFRGNRRGEPVLVLGGWDDFADRPCRIRVKTDAARVWQVDLMGNRTPIATTGGEAVWELSREPGSLLLEGATLAEANARDLADLPLPANAVVRIPPTPADGRAPDFRIRTADRMVDYHQAIPEVRHRVWKGPQDLSADVWLERVGDDVRLIVVVEDDVRAPGDRVVAKVRTPGGDLREVRLENPKVDGTRSRYERILRANEFGFGPADLAKGLVFTLRVFEDDGEGPDGYLMLTDDDEPMKQLKFF